MAKYKEDMNIEIEQQYKEFKSRLNKIVTPGSQYSEVVDRYPHVLFDLHSCSDMCEKNCLRRGKVTEQKNPIPFRILHLMLKE